MSIEAPIQRVTAPDHDGVRRVTIAMNGVTGRMGMNQHLIRSICAIRAEGGLQAGETTIWPEPILVGRSERKLRRLAAEHGIERWTTDLDACLADPEVEVYFDAQLTQQRPAAVRRAIAAGKHVYCEKPVTETLEEGLELARLARDAGVKNGVVQDKLFLPGLLKLAELIETGFFGRILSVRGEFGYWVFPGPVPPAAAALVELPGGGRRRDPHRHVLPLALRARQPVRAREVGLRPRRDPHPRARRRAGRALRGHRGGRGVRHLRDRGRADRADELVLVRPRRPRRALRAAGRRHARQRRRRPARVPHPAGGGHADARLEPGHPEPDRPPGAVAARCRSAAAYDNGFKVQWEKFLRHVVLDEPFPWDFLEAAKGIQLAELGMRSWQERRFVEVPELAL